MKTPLAKKRATTDKSGRPKAGQNSTRGGSLCTTAIACAFLFLLLTIGVPASSAERSSQISGQRNILDSAVRQLFSNNRSYQKSQFELPESDRRASLDPSAIEDLGETYEPTGLVASFPFAYPVMGPRKSSGYGYRVHPVRGYSSRHKGVDLAAPVGASIRAMAKGRVIFADPYAGYGKLVVIDHGHGITTHYAHCDRLTVHPGQLVDTGQVIAEVGSTGSSTGPHLHLEVRVKGQSMNPEIYFEGLVAKAEG